MESTRKEMNKKEINWEEYKFKSGLVMDVSKCPSCKKPRTMYTLRNEEYDPDHGNATAFAKALKESGECCNPECGGVWGAGCWHCHSPEHFFDDALDKGAECVTDGCDNKGTVWRYDKGMSLTPRCPGCDDDLIADKAQAPKGNKEEDINVFIYEERHIVKSNIEQLRGAITSMTGDPSGQMKSRARRSAKSLLRSSLSVLSRLEDYANERKQIDTPLIDDFIEGVRREATHQRGRWGPEHDDKKTHADWFWLLGYLGQKALYSALIGDKDKAMHHTITTAAALYNWHDAIRKEM